MKDRFARPCRTVRELTNVGEALMDTAKIRMLCLLNCDEKYKKKTASDFELFREWERVLPLCEGSGAAALYRAECELLGINDLEVKEKWKRGIEALDALDFEEYSLPMDQIDLNDILSNFIKLNRGKSAPVSLPHGMAVEAVEVLDCKDVHLIMTLPTVPFARPNPYAAEQALGRILYDEKYKKEDLSLILCQLAILLLLDPPAGRKIHLHLSSEHDPDPALAFLSYLEDRRLFEGTVYFGIELDTAARIYDDLCGFLSERITLCPELILSVSDFGDGLAERLAALFRRYPRGAVTLGGVRTDSPLYPVTHRLLETALG